MLITFKKIAGRINAYHVYADDKLIGSVRKDERWTVRGTSVQWEAWSKGKCLNTNSMTRKEAASVLERFSK